MSRSLRQQLLTAYRERVKSDGMTLAELIRLANLACSADSLSRKLRGTQSLRSWEIERLATALRVEVTAGRPKAAA